MSRGPHPEDAELFGPASTPKLLRAVEEVSWLLGRGYSVATAVAAAGSHHQLTARQRAAVTRSACSDAAREGRLGRLRAAREAEGGSLHIDGFNLIISLEVALSGGVLVRGRDGALRDLAGLRGTYNLLPATERAIDLVGEHLGAFPPAEVHFLLDRAVSNSGRLRALLEARAASWKMNVHVALEARVDALLAASDWVVTADSAILDRCGRWVNLAGEVILARVPGAWIVG